MTSKLRAHEAMLLVLAPVAIKSHCSAMSLSLVEHVHCCSINHNWVRRN